MENPLLSERGNELEMARILQAFFNYCDESKSSLEILKYASVSNFKNTFDLLDQRTKNVSEFHDVNNVSQPDVANDSVEGNRNRLNVSFYVSGMHILVAPFLFVMPELDSFTSFSCLIMKHCPRYILRMLRALVRVAHWPISACRS